jgi:hypothetical protein
MAGSVRLGGGATFDAVGQHSDPGSIIRGESSRAVEGLEVEVAGLCDDGSTVGSLKSDGCVFEDF